MNLEKLMQMLTPYVDADEEDVQVYDLSTDKGLEGYNEQLDQIENAELDVLNLFGINSKEWVKSMRDLGQKIHDQNKKNDIVKKSIKQMGCTVIDHSDLDDDTDEAYEINVHKESEDNKEFKRPSELLTISQKLQLHKLVQEYVDTTIKPFNKGVLTNDQINDAYAGLYEFGAWILNK